ncbi:MAG: GntR family transcriptional regulator [Herminiimonas sp.]|nr:GntR family transcriptional regulator [Herminiimonas sp.]
MSSASRNIVPAVETGGDKSLGKVAYEHLRQAIENGSLKPGDRVSVNGLAEMMNLSRTPVREAISWLETDGLVAHEPARGRVIASLDHQMVNELSEIRIVLEVKSVELAARNASVAEIELLREMLAIEESLLDDPARRDRHNRRFHAAIYRCAHNRYLISTLNALHAPMLLLGPAAATDPERQRQAYAEHVALVDAISRRDAEKAAEVITHHLVSGQRLRIKNILRQLDNEI